MIEITKRQKEVLELMSEGYTKKEAAAELNLSPNTIKVHCENLIKRFKVRNMVHVTKLAMRAGIIHLFPLLLFSQPDTLQLTGSLGGTYTAQHAISVDSANSYSVFGQPVILQIGSCDTLDELIPGIAVLGDDCIRDAEWNTSGYSEALPDSASFFEPATMDFFKTLGILAYDDCGIDTFKVQWIEFLPPGGPERSGENTREIRVIFRAVDWVGYAKEQLMIWFRKPDSAGCW